LPACPCPGTETGQTEEQRHDTCLANGGLHMLKNSATLYMI
jgi:hypothetical protein